MFGSVLNTSLFSISKEVQEQLSHTAVQKNIHSENDLASFYIIYQ